ncbi:MAG: hypothetical protein PHN68_08780 [Prolixibacteraceae bacterium]|nr:hypothetical protein [Prolixibacteraceae bacterium]MDD4755858.1 hypothetical protein [Prolixibacteraceae bacterium]
MIFIIKNFFIKIVALLFTVSLFCLHSAGATSYGREEGQQIYLSVFDVDATPPAGSQLTYQEMKNSWDLGLRARGVVISGAGKPVVLLAVDWIGISNESQDRFKQALAEAAGTSPGRVAVHTLHQHDAPICDFTAEKLLENAGVDPGCFNGSFARKMLVKLQDAVKSSIENARPVSHVAYGEAPVYEVASNRRILNDEGKVEASRSSSCRDPLLRALPEGVIDPMVSVVSFWDNEEPLAVLSFYATHPQSYYLTQIANPDFPGIARFYRQLEVPDALHIHFNGAGGNIAAGKYNDGSKEMRQILAGRLADGMKRAWDRSRKSVVTAEMINWETEPISLPATDNIEEIEQKITDKNLAFNYLPNNMGKLGWYKRNKEGKTIDLGCLSIGDVRLLFMPGELFVEYQLAAKSMRPGLFVAMAAYGDYGPFYIGTEEAYDEGGYEIVTSPVTGGSEAVLMEGLKKLLHVD